MRSIISDQLRLCDLVGLALFGNGDPHSLGAQLQPSARPEKQVAFCGPKSHKEYRPLSHLQDHTWEPVPGAFAIFYPFLMKEMWAFARV